MVIFPAPLTSLKYFNHPKWHSHCQSGRDFLPTPPPPPKKRHEPISQVKKTLIFHVNCLQVHCKDNKVQLPNEVTLSSKKCTGATIQTQLTECFWNWNTSYNYMQHTVILNSMFFLKTVLNAFTSSCHYNLTLTKKKIKLNLKKPHKPWIVPWAPKQKQSVTDFIPHT